MATSVPCIIYAGSRACRHCEIMFGQSKNKNRPWGFNQEVSMSADVSKCMACGLACKYTLKYSRAHLYVCTTCFQQARDAHAVIVHKPFPLPDTDQATLYYENQQGTCSAEYASVADTIAVVAWRAQELRHNGYRHAGCVVCGRKN